MTDANKPYREPWLHNYPETRAWIYRILAAVLVIVAGWQGWAAIDNESILNLVAAVLNLSGAVGFGVSKSNTPKRRE